LTGVKRISQFKAQGLYLRGKYAIATCDILDRLVLAGDGPPIASA